MTALIVAASIVLLTSPSLDAGTVTVNALDQGSYTELGHHSPSVTNYLVGNYYIAETHKFRRNFFVFDLPDGQITGAELHVFDNGYGSNDATETYETYDVSTSIATLRGGGETLTDVYHDLGTGVIYGNVVTSAAGTGTTITVPLNASFINAAQGLAGGEIAIGGALTTLDLDDTTSEVIFLSTGGIIAQLELQIAGTATPTPTRTPTTTPTPTFTAVPTASPSPTPTAGGPPHVGDPDTAKAADKCAGGMFKSAGKLVVNRLKSFEKCADGIFNCVQTKPAGEKRDACVTKMKTKCDKELAKVDADVDKLDATFGKRCGTLTAGDVFGDGGLGFEGVKDACDRRFLITVDDVASAVHCLGVHHQCAASQLFMVQMPRAGEMMDLAGVDLPDCLFGGGSGGDIGDLAAGKTLAKCQKAAKKAGATFAAKKLKALQRCVDAVFGCVQLENDAESFAACLTKARGTCDKSFDAIAAAAATLPQTVDAKCAAIGAALLDDGGMDLDNGISDKNCTPVGVPTIATLVDYETCLFRQHECIVEDLIAFENPRAAELLDLVDRDLVSAFCPSP